MICLLFISSCYFYYFVYHCFLCFCNRYAKSVGANHFHTSAKANKGLEEVFTDLSQRMVDRRAEKNKSSPAASAPAQRNKLVIVDDGRVSEAPKKGCC